MTPYDAAAILLAGTAAGTINTVVGSGTLITFPTLVALGFPAVTLRDSMERPEALDAGTILMTGLEPEEVLRNVDVAVGGGSAPVPEGYDVPNTSTRTVNFILSTAGRHATWAGLR